MHLPRSLCVELGLRDMLADVAMVTMGVGGWEKAGKLWRPGLQP